MTDKTEQPTPRRLRKAREEGDVPVSAAFGQAVGFVVALALLPSAVVGLAQTAAELVRSAVEGHTASPLELASLVVAISAPVTLAAGFAVFALGAVQTGGLFSGARLAPELGRLDPIQGTKALFSVQRWIGLLRALIAAGLLLGSTYVVLRASLPRLIVAPGELGLSLAEAATAARRLGVHAAVIGLVLGAVDLLVVRRAWLKRWMMSRDEVRREYRENEGDPELKAARRRAHQQLLTSAAVHAVKDASVVVINPTHLAVALRYTEGEDPAPRVVAQGDGEIARRIVEAAHAYGVPVIRDVPIARALAELELGDEIPEALYEAVAEILNEVWRGEPQR
jgi:FlhB-like protein